jgi:hypothetical protein
MHRIRLRHPWQAELLSDEPARTDSSFQLIHYRRKFNCPTGIENAQLSLTIRPLTTETEVTGVQLNGRELTAASQEAYPVDQLEPFNELSIALRLGNAALNSNSSAATEAAPPLDSLLEVVILIDG